MGRLDVFYQQMKVLTEKYSIKKSSADAWLDIRKAKRMERKYYPVLHGMSLKYMAKSPL